jgi:hypothetical protein
MPRELHCWAHGPMDEDGCGSTCMLRAGHAGHHHWRRDDQISVSVTPSGMAESYRAHEVELEVEVPRAT